MKYLSILCLGIFMGSSLLRAQNYQLPRYQLSISYFGEMLTNGGIRLGCTTPLSQRINQKRDSDFTNNGWIIGCYINYY